MFVLPHTVYSSDALLEIIFAKTPVGFQTLNVIV
jgi:hypothetical protein